MTVREALRTGAAALEASRVPDARLDAEYLLADLLRTDRLRLLADADTPLTAAQAETYRALLARRAAREPLQYILGTQPFMGHLLAVSPAALIPRADTEILCEEALAALRPLCQAGPGVRALDLCTGSGALAIALKAACPSAAVTATDLSDDALRLARDNAFQLGVDVSFVQGDLFAPLAGERFALIVSNPPYIPRPELPTLQAEVLFEPRMALDGGEDGLDFYRRIAREAPAHLVRGGQLMLEIGSPQAGDVCALLSENGLTRLRVVRDLAGLDRVVVGVLEGPSI